MKSRSVRSISVVLIVLHLLVGIGALAGGLAAITNPQQPLGMPVTTLENSPFSNFLIPGIILFVVIGFGNLFSAMCLGLKMKFKEYISGIFACALIIWIIVQCIMLRGVVFLHVLFFMIGVIQGILASILLFEKRLFPTNVILKTWENHHQ
ncbi:MAG: hypothetical protein AB9856_07795 [Cellulosilyticaceae bacterium]